MTTTPRVDLAEQLLDRTHRALARIAYEVGVMPDDLSDVRCLAWMVEVLKHIKDTPHNFPSGKWATIKTLERVVANNAEQVARIYYGNV